MSANILAAIAAVIVIVFIAWLLRRGVLKEKYAVLWIGLAAGAALFAIVPGAGRWISDLVGVEIPANLLFFVTLVVLVLVSIQLSYELSRHEARIRRLAEEVALLEERLSRLRSDIDDEPDR